MECIRQRTLENEKLILCEKAMKCCDTAGRRIPEPECEIRTAYQRDRDRIIHSDSFRRLKHKTQVFLSPENDHYHTRLTHTLEVTQIARTIARALRLNEDLTEAISLGHDLGHTPFGHAGERALDGMMDGGFRHYEQSLRVVDIIEGGRGLNLTFEVRDGIVCHTKGQQAQTMEGRIVRLADRIAYINHDIADAVRGGVIRARDIPADVISILGDTKSRRVNKLVRSVIENTVDEPVLGEDEQWAFDTLHSFMFENVYTNPVCKGEESKAVKLVQRLYEYFTEHTDELPDEYLKIAWHDGTERAAGDYISGMTDGYAVKMYNSLFIPKGWTFP